MSFAALKQRMSQEIMAVLTNVCRGIAECALAVIVFPGIVELLFLTLGGFRSGRTKPRRSHQEFKLAVLIPAHNQEQWIARCVESVTASAAAVRESVRIIVIADNCTDRTAARAAQAGAEVLLRRDAASHGKSYSLAFAYEKVLRQNFDGVLVIDADCIVSDRAVTEVVRVLESGADAVQTRYEVHNSEESSHARLMALALLGFTVIRPRGRCFWGLSAGIFGTGFGLRREVLASVPYLMYSLVEDLEFHLQLVRHGFRVAFLDCAAVYGQMPIAAPGVVARRSRWEAGRLQLVRKDARTVLRDIFRGQTRLIEPLADLLTLPLALQSAALIALLLIGSRDFRLYSLFGMGVLCLHVLACTLAGKQPLTSLRALVIVPFYILWKIAISPSIISTAWASANWVRTERREE